MFGGFAEMNHVLAQIYRNAIAVKGAEGVEYCWQGEVQGERGSGDTKYKARLVKADTFFADPMSNKLSLIHI